MRGWPTSGKEIVARKEALDEKDSKIKLKNIFVGRSHNTNIGGKITRGGKI